MSSLQRRAFIMLLAALPLSRVWAMASVFRQAGVQKIQGQVRINGELAKEGMLVDWGDQIETAANSSAIFVLGKDAFLLRENTKVILGIEAANRFIRLQTGKLLSVFGTGEKTIETQTVLLGIRGTGCYLEASPEGTYVCLCYGHVLLTPKGAREQSFSYQTRHHEKPYWVDAERVQSAEVRNHSDAELTLLEALVGRTPPFTDGGRRYD